LLNWVYAFVTLAAHLTNTAITCKLKKRDEGYEIRSLFKRGSFGIWKYSRQMETLNDQENLDTVLLGPVTY